MMTTMFRVAGLLSVVVIGILSLVPGHARPHVVSPSSFEHVAAYFVAATLLSLGFAHARPSFRPAADTNSAAILGIASLLSAYAGVLEVAQLFVPGRMPGILDWSAGTLGAWLGAGLVWLLRGLVPDALR